MRRLPKLPADIDVAQMTEAQLHANTDEALADMDAIYNYIANTLLAPENAMGQYNRIAKAILTLFSNYSWKSENICPRKLFIWYHNYQNNSFLGEGFLLF